MKKLTAAEVQTYSGGEQLSACFWAGLLLVVAFDNWWNPLGYYALEGAIIGGTACIG